ncbi:MAG: hypothetical protein KME57_26330 [Scytonema hyalinum WJT4-NPBG1]|nr:hypothetical protein [Scytonema hyalinum WJT4-NPBG1]
MKKRHSDCPNGTGKKVRLRGAQCPRAQSPSGVAQTLLCVGAACPQDLRQWQMKRSPLSLFQVSSKKKRSPPSP